MIERPTNITICFIGGDIERTNYQQNLILSQYPKYNIFFWRRCDKFQGYYYTWSQIANECISESPNEFIIFINPKVEPSVNDIDYMVDRLLCGYCFVSVIGTGYCGTTIELFRNIGLFDERYLGSEFEDDDFSLRLKMFGKAIIWGFDFDRYPTKESALSPNRGCAVSFFEKKWFQMSDDHYLLDMNLFNTQKKLHGHIIKSGRNDIYQSWMDYTMSEFSSHHVGLRGKFAKIEQDWRGDISFRDIGRIEINVESGKLRVQFDCNTNTKIHIVFVNAVDNKEYNLSDRIAINSNMWHINSIEDELPMEVKIFHEGEKVYHNRYIKSPFNIQLEIGLRITGKI